MKKILFSALLTVTVASLTACSKQEERDMTNTEQADSVLNSSTSSEPASAQSTSSTGLTASDRAETALDWAGEYEGVFPCADCEGIKVELELHPDKTYELKEEYLGKGKNNETEIKGSFSFDSQQPSIIILDAKAENRKFFVGENFLEARNLENGQKIESKLNYKLLKKAS
ncbi:copper resistance protein NlpE N-terminal domain-containing protein [Acinetobacter bohemicus]|uniref:copper resistance protein NlpE n=1 Tax=Acinetobacter sp. S4397-1 TaxID=2972915 RepID=UPI00209B61EF|nr:copper resistance protein NlpE [Acinetobacter sp. S4397-1]MCO8046166.1 copper resistance protein NlpE N-terminal domain-containing protein [Acinetobacter sp. S4397-1]